MRDYAKVAPQFWTGRTGKALKAAGPEAVIVAMYLMTSPHANMIGVYHCPIAYISIDTGLPLEGASKGLASAIEADFCTFDDSCDYVFVHQFAEYQIGPELAATDNRVKGVVNELAKVPKGQCWQGFRARYAHPYNLPLPTPSQPKKPSPSEAPSKPGAEAEAGTEENTSDANASGGKPPPVDLGEVIFGLGLPLLLSAGVPDRNARSMLGLMRKTHGAEAVVAALQRCADERALQPVEFLQGCLKSAKTTAGKHTGFATKNYREGVEADGSLV